jgi:thiol-disulfide isomerase/thioredoxin
MLAIGHRRIILKGLTVAAAAGGAGGAFWQWQHRANPEETARAEAIAALMNADFAGLEEGRVIRLSTWAGQPMLINFWASWCGPCVREMPLLDRFFKQAKASTTRPSWQIVGLAIDTPENVKKYLTHQPVSFPVALGGARGAALMQALGNSSGGLPFTLVFNEQKKIIHQKLGETKEKDLLEFLA